MQQTPLYYDDVNIGDEAPEYTVPRLTRTQIVRYAGASGDFNPIHHESVNRSAKAPVKLVIVSATSASVRVSSRIRAHSDLMISTESRADPFSVPALPIHTAA